MLRWTWYDWLLVVLLWFSGLFGLRIGLQGLVGFAFVFLWVCLRFLLLVFLIVLWLVSWFVFDFGFVRWVLICDVWLV